MDKDELRQEMKETLRAMNDDERKHITEKLHSYLLNATIWKEAETLGITVSGGIEWDTEPLIQEAWKQGKTVTVPKCIPETRVLEFYVLEDFSQLEVQYYNLKEPNPEKTKKISKESIDLLVVPGLVYDKSGYRIGFGAGYYDRFLVNFEKPTVSLLAEKQLIHKVPNEPFDIAVRHLITENGFIPV
jgi:5-formyltetrahydrofolate cyclo-ligase